MFAAWERKQGVHRELERYAAKINRRILGRFFGYWGNLHDAYAKVSGVSDGMRNRKNFLKWAQVIGVRRTARESFMRLVAFRREQYLVRGMRGLRRLMKLKDMYDRMPAHNNVILCDKVFRAFHLLKVKRDVREKRRAAVGEVCDAYRVLEYFQRWRRTLSERRKTRFLLKRWGRRLKEKYLVLMERQKRVGTRLRVCFRQMHTFIRLSHHATIGLIRRRFSFICLMCFCAMSV